MLISIAAVIAGLVLLLVLMARFPSALPRQPTRRKGIFLPSAFVIYQLSLYYAGVAG